MKKIISEIADMSKKIHVGDYISTSLNREPDEIREIFILDAPGNYDEDKCQSIKYVTYQQVTDGYACIHVGNHWVKSHQILLNSHSEDTPNKEVDPDLEVEQYNEGVIRLKKLLPKRLLTEEFPPPGWHGQGLKNNQTLKASLKSKIGNEIHNLVNNKYFEHIPLTEIFEILKKYGVVALQEDGTKFQGMLTGRSGTAMIEMGYIESDDPYGPECYIPFTNSILRIQWYKMDNSNKYEVVAYLG